MWDFIWTNKEWLFSGIGVFVLLGRYCQMLWIDFFYTQHRSRFADCFDLFISPASEARFGQGLVLDSDSHLASAGG